jgi:folate-binding protein YgfZ
VVTGAAPRARARRSPSRSPRPRHLETYKIGTDAQITDLTDERAILSVVGPATPRVTSIEGLRAEDAHREARVGGVECRAVATSHGLDLIVSADRMADVLAALVDAGAVEVTEAAAEILRVESGRPRFDKDMTTRTIPQEAGINERAVSFEKGCYIGQETVARLHYRGKPNRRLAGLRLEAPASDGDVVTLGDREVGTVGTAVTSPAHGAIALAILRREAEPGAGVAVGSSAIAARVVDPPF